MEKRIRHFVGLESSKQLGFIDHLHNLGLNATVELPELVVVGDQNTGKSSVLQAITEISFPVEDTMCTRFPIKMSFRQTHSKKTTVRATILPGPISEEDDELMERIPDFFMEKEELSPEVMEEVVREATRTIFGDEASISNGPITSPNMTLSDATLRIERSGPDEMHWTIVDLPGLLQNGEKPGDRKSSSAPNGRRASHPRSNAAIAEGLVRTYLSNERNIVIVVVDNVDVERHRSLKLIEEIPGLRNRSIGVLTKCDLKQQTSDQWMIKLLRNELPTVCPLDHGWFGLCNRKPIEEHIADAERDENEQKEFRKLEWAGVPSDRTGIKSLMTYIDKERRSQLQKSIPLIIQEIRDKLGQCEADLKGLGEARTTAQAQRFYVLQFCTEMQKMVHAALRGHYQDIPSNDPKRMLRLSIQKRLDRFYQDMRYAILDVPFTNYREDLRTLRSGSSNPEDWERMVETAPGIYAEIYKQAQICQAASLPGTIHPDVLENIFRKQSAHWEGIARGLVEDSKDIVKECHNVLLRIAITDSKTRLEVNRRTAKMSEEWNKQIDVALKDLIDDNQKRPLTTRDPRYKLAVEELDKMRGEILRPDPLELGLNWPKSSPSAAEIQGTPGPESERRSSAGISTHLSDVLHFRAKLETYYEIALYRFIDNVATQVVERHVLGQNCPMRTVSAESFIQLSDECLNTVAGEDEANALRRTSLRRDQARYHEALDKWEQIRVL